MARAGWPGCSACACLSPTVRRPAPPPHVPGRPRARAAVARARARAGRGSGVGARFARRVAAAVPGSGLAGAQLVGIPLRRQISTLDRGAHRAEARGFFGLPADGPVLLVFGGSQGARSLNTAVAGAIAELTGA